jgi:hypothetical protein
MPDPETIQDPAAAFDMAERTVLYMLTDPKDNQPVWSPEDLGRVLGNPMRALDAIGGLRRAGLIHQTTDEFVFASRAAVRMVQMTDHAI